MPNQTRQKVVLIYTLKNFNNKLNSEKRKERF